MPRSGRSGFRYGQLRQTRLHNTLVDGESQQTNDRDMLVDGPSADSAEPLGRVEQALADLRHSLHITEALYAGDSRDLVLQY
jgi:hypothetical protein